jgi:hypothetical protein
LAYGWELTSDPIFLERCIDMNNPNYPDLFTAMHSGNIWSNVENRFAPMSLSEHMNYP